MSRAREFADLAGSASAGGLTGKNLILNGAMKVAQRGTSSSSAGKLLDGHHWVVNNFDELVFAQSQSSTAPDGFANSMRFQVTTAESALAADEIIYVRQRIEGQDLQHLKFGTSSAESITLSFWVRSSLTGKYSVLIYNDDAQRSNLQSYTVSAADTWEHKTITFDGDTSNGFDDDNNRSMTVFFTLAAGTNYTGTPHTGWGAYSATDDFAHSDAVNFAAQTGNWYITGIQLEVGQQATPFEHEDAGTTIAKCSRYYVDGVFRGAGYMSSTSATFSMSMPYPMRLFGSAVSGATLTASGNGAAVDSGGTRRTFTISAMGLSSGTTENRLSCSFTHSYTFGSGDNAIAGGLNGSFTVDMEL